MEITREEKTALVILSLFLIAGAVFMHVKRSFSSPRIIITESDGSVKVSSLKEMSAVLDEKRRVSINDAALEELIKLPGIGEGLAVRIISYRDKNGPFLAVEDILNVRGIGEKKLEKIKHLIRV